MQTRRLAFKFSLLSSFDSNHNLLVIAGSLQPYPYDQLHTFWTPLRAICTSYPFSVMFCLEHLNSVIFVSMLWTTPHLYFSLCSSVTVCSGPPSLLLCPHSTVSNLSQNTSPLLFLSLALSASIHHAFTSWECSVVTACSKLQHSQR